MIDKIIEYLVLDVICVNSILIWILSFFSIYQKDNMFLTVGRFFVSISVLLISFEITTLQYTNFNFLLAIFMSGITLLLTNLLMNNHKELVCEIKNNPILIFIFIKTAIIRCVEFKINNLKALIKQLKI